MLIVCPECETSYQVNAASLGDGGRSVRCARCQAVWFAEPSKALMVLEGTALLPDSSHAYENPPARHDEWWAGDNADQNGGAPSPGSEEWGIAAGEVPSDMSEDSPLQSERVTIEVTTEAPPLVPMSEHADGESADADSHFDAAIDVETVAARGAKLAAPSSPKRKRGRAGLGLAAILLISVLATLVAGRVQIVRRAPQTGALYKAVGLGVNLRGLMFKDVRIVGEKEDDVPVLVVEGTIVNSVNRPVEVPRMRFALLNPSGMETYAWTAAPGRTLLGEGETLAFRSRLASPPADIRDVQVRFLNRRDREASR